jgi:hypothetical protein
MDRVVDGAGIARSEAASEAVKVIIVDIRHLGKLKTGAKVIAWRKKFTLHLEKLVKTSTAVRADLGPPPPSSLRK